MIRVLDLATLLVLRTLCLTRREDQGPSPCDLSCFTSADANPTRITGVTLHTGLYPPTTLPSAIILDLDFSHLSCPSKLFVTFLALRWEGGVPYHVVPLRCQIL